MDTTLTTTKCLACQSSESLSLGHWDNMPLSVLGLPRTHAEAVEMTGLTLEMRRCAECGHVFNSRFDYTLVPYEDTSNLVFNQGRYWVEYQEELAAAWIDRYSIRDQVVVEIGPGDGGFLERFAKAGNRCLAWEPGPDAERCEARGLEAHREYFRPEHIDQYRPDVIICRHVIEHLPDPLAFLRDIRRRCVATGVKPLFLAEVPCFDKALEQKRVNDFLYEHVSNFTENSFRVLFEKAGFRVVETQGGYNQEVITLGAYPQRRQARDAAKSQGRRFTDSSARFAESIARQVSDVERTLATWAAEGKRVALWGATGKGAAMTNFFGLTPERVPLVVDSDTRKHGFYVPGTGQRIQSPSALVDEGVDVILICTQWRARDIEFEIRNQWKLDADLYVHFRGAMTPLSAGLEL